MTRMGKMLKCPMSNTTCPSNALTSTTTGLCHRLLFHLFSSDVVIVQGEAVCCEVVSVVSVFTTRCLCFVHALAGKAMAGVQSSEINKRKSSAEG